MKSKREMFHTPSENFLSYIGTGNVENSKEIVLKVKLEGENKIRTTNNNE